MLDRIRRSQLQRKWSRWAATAIIGFVILLPLGGIAFMPGRAGAEGEKLAAEGEKPAAEKPAPSNAYLGTKACTDKCHNKEAAQYRADVHSKTDRDASARPDSKGCEGCHGPASAHKAAVDADDEDLKVQDLAKAPGADLTKVCARCHSTVVSPAEFADTVHADEGMTCRDCHAVHQDKPTDRKLKQPANDLCLSCHQTQKAEFRANAHHPLFEGRIDCVDCHDPHGGSDPGSIKEGVDELCTSCHREKQGPFVFEHSPNVDEMEDGCLSCHAPHGTPVAKLVKMSGRGLCLQCHTDITNDGRHRARPGKCWRSGCHARLHGSQTDATLRR